MYKNWDWNQKNIIIIYILYKLQLKLGIPIHFKFEEYYKILW